MKRLLAGMLSGVLAALAGIVLGIPGMVGAILAVALVALVPRSPVILAGGLIGLGGTWLILFSRQAWLCAQPGQPCGATPLDMLPWLAFASAIALTGLVAGAFSIARNRA